MAQRDQAAQLLTLYWLLNLYKGNFPEEKRKMKMVSPIQFIKKHGIWFFLLSLLSFAAVVYYLVMIRTGLPSDEEMIAHFQEHRMDIEELVRRYRSYEPAPNTPHYLWIQQGGTPELLERAGIGRIDFTNRTPWLPAPYSIETAKSLHQIISDKNNKDFSVFHKNGMLYIEFLPYEKFKLSHFRYVLLWKDLIFVPEVPRIENGALLWPMRADGRYSSQARVLLSLNRLPSDFKNYECVYRQVEPQWLLRMCNGH